MPSPVIASGRALLRPPATLPATAFAVAFTNSTNVVTSATSSALQFLAAGTVEAWVYPTVNNGSNGERICDDGGFTLLPSVSFDPSFQVNGGTQATGATVLSLNAWTHIAGVFTGAAVTLYVNGVQAATVAQSGTSGSGSFYSVGNRSGGDRPFIGLIQEFRVSGVARYSGTFTPQHAPFVSDANTLILWHMNEGTGTTCHDSSSNGITGTLAGSTLPTWGAGLF